MWRSRVEDLATHSLPLEDAPRGYEMFRAKEDGCVKVVLCPREPEPGGLSW